MNINDGALSFDAYIKDTDFQRQIAEMERRIIGLSNTTVQETERIDHSFNTVAVAAGSIFSAAAFQSFIDQMINVRKESQMLEKSFEVLLGSKAKADKMLSDIKSVALQSPLSIDDFSNASQLLLSFNIDAEKVIPTLKSIGDISMGNAQKFQSLSLAFAQMSSVGKLMGQDLLQMINAGFNPLQVISQKTGKSIGDLKKEMESGSISAEMVADAFRTATEAGGQFYGMMESQSQGIAGKQAELTSAITEMYNTLGTSSEGVIAKGYDLTTSLVKNYEKVGEVVISLIATYGTYKAAVVAVTVVEQLRYQATLAQMAGFTKMQAITEVLRGKVAALNATMLANPAVAITAGIVALGYATYKLATYQTDAEKAQSRLNEAMIEAEKSSLSETRELAKLKGELSALEKGTDRYNEVKEKIVANYSKYHEGLKKEIEDVGLLETTYNKLTQAIQQSFGARQYDAFIKSEQDNLDNIISKNLGKIQDRLYKDLGDEEGAKVYTKIKQSILEGTELSSEIISVLDKVQDKGTFRADSRIDSYIRNIRNAQKVADEMDKKARVKFGIKDEKSNPEDDVNKETTKFRTFSEQVRDAKQKVLELEKELNNLRKGIVPENIGENEQFDFAKGIEDKTKALKEAEDRLNILLTGKTKSDVGKGDNTAEQLKEKKLEAEQWLLNKQKELSSEQIKLELESEQKRLDIQNDNYEKRLAQNELNYRKELQYIKDFEANKLSTQQEVAQKIYTAENGGNAKEFDFSKFDTSKLPTGLRPEDIKEQVGKLTQAAQAAWENADALSYEQMTKEFMSFQQQRADATKTYQDLINQYESIGLGDRVELIKKERDQVLGEISTMEIQSSEIWQNLFQNVDYLSAESVSNIVSKLKELIGQIEDAGVKEALLKQLEETEKSIGYKNPFIGLKKGIDDFKKASDDVSRNKALENIGDAAKNMSDVVSSSLDSVISGLSDLGLMDAGIEKMLGDLTSLVASLGNASQGIARLSAGDITAAPQAVAGVVGTITSVFSLFDSKSRDIERKIKAHQKQLSELGRIYKDIEYQVNNAVGTDYYQEQFKAIENLKKQQAELNDLIYQEGRKKRKNRDDGAIESWKGQIKDAEIKIKEINKEITETLVQTNFKDLSNQLADALVSAFEAGEAAAEDFDKTFNKVIANAVKNSLKMQILEPEINKFTQALSKHMLDNNYSAVGFDFETWRELLKNAGNAFTSGLEEFEKYFDVVADDITQDPLTGAIKSVSEETASALAGQITMMRIKQAETAEFLKGQLYSAIVRIADNTEYNKHLLGIYQVLQRMEGNNSSNILRAKGLL